MTREPNRNYIVTYEIDIWAKNHGDAAERCYDWLRDTKAMAPIFSVQDVETGELVTINLWECESWK